MNTTNLGNIPDIDPANNDTLAGVMQFAFYKLMQGVDGMLPAQVIQVSEDRTRVQVQLLITVITTNGAQISRAQIASLPVFTIGGGGYLLSFPLNPGDLGYVVANDRDISLFLQNYTQSPPNTGRIKSFSDGVFIPQAMANFTIGSGDSGNALLQSKDGTVKITLGTGVITISATHVIINGYDFGPLGITPPGGTFAVLGNITATGTIIPNV